MKKVKLSSKLDGRALHWFRRDLRLKDNTALYEASQFAKNGDLLTIYFATPLEWKQHSEAPIKIDFWLNCLKDLQKNLKGLKIPLLVRTVDKFEDIPSELTKICEELQVAAVFCNKEYEVDEIVRDRKSKEALSLIEVEFHDFDDFCICPPNSVIAKSSGKTSTVFTPFKKRWFKVIGENPKYIEVVKDPSPNKIFMKEYSEIVPSIPGFDVSSKDYEPGEDKAFQNLLSFVQSRISRYKSDRDFPYKDGTSRLSHYLSGGILSARTCLALALAKNSNQFDSGNEGIVTWINELCWRDFYNHILVSFPHVCKSLPFKKIYKSLPWNEDEEDFEKWKEGKTGFPIVDAAMRQLLKTGWMHNRLRMVVSSFLVKDLLIDWRKGEEHFMCHLIDGNLASNNGGWYQNLIQAMECFYGDRLTAIF
eukprot:NODE_25_length_41203_cov_0.917113.p10 type:complete len:421 gc:universal NODE_25_length_41203_cov_0.917113:40123-38861(-)